MKLCLLLLIECTSISLTWHCVVLGGSDWRMLVKTHPPSRNVYAAQAAISHGEGAVRMDMTSSCCRERSWSPYESTYVFNQASSHGCPQVINRSGIKATNRASIFLAQGSDEHALAEVLVPFRCFFFSLTRFDLASRGVKRVRTNDLRVQHCHVKVPSQMPTLGHLYV